MTKGTRGVLVALASLPLAALLLIAAGRTLAALEGFSVPQRSVEVAQGACASQQLQHGIQTSKTLPPDVLAHLPARDAVPVYEMEPNEDFASATFIPCPLSVAPSSPRYPKIDPLGADVDYYVTTGTPGSTVLIDIDTVAVGSTLNSMLGTWDSSAVQTGFSDDDPAPGETPTNESYVQVTMPPDGVLYFAVTAFDDADFNSGGDQETSGEYVLGLACPPCGAVIDNGTVQLGVNCEGHLNLRIDNDPLGIGFMGLRYIPTGAASTEPGCQCEGWGAADQTSGVAGYANVTVDGGAVNLTLVSFVSTASTAISVVEVGTQLRVTHNYHPSPVTPNLYEVLVTIQNVSPSPVQLLYRRVMDWDIYPTPFLEYVTLFHGTAANLLRSDTNGFNSANPFSFASFQPGPVTDTGPDDIGALFDFDFGTLAPGATKTFKTFYGAAGTEADALAAISQVGAEAFSLGQPSTPDGPDQGVPNTFIFAFSGIGGTGFCQTADQCDDGNECTEDFCDEDNDVCVHDPLDGTPCDDGSICTDPDTCHAGACGGVPVDCNDDDPCTVDSCHPVDGCTHTIPAETCNGLDDNCNGLVDEGNPGGGASCDTGLLGVCAQGTVICEDGALTCVQDGGPGPELCNGLDDDCDGEVDEPADSDGDGVTDCLDNCPDAYNPGQENLDGDAQGDACDCTPEDPGNPLPPEVGALHVSVIGAATEVYWDPVPDVAGYRAYRGYRTAGNPWVYNHECLASVTLPSAPDPLDPLGFTFFYYLASSHCGGDNESGLGADSPGCTSYPPAPCSPPAGNPRPRPYPCPPSTLDLDGDGAPEVSDNCPGFANPTQSDVDGDSHGDACDNCPAVFDRTQGDVDGDGLGDVCDPDIDGDTVLNGADNCVREPNPLQEDGDGDGVGDACDNCPGDFNPGQENADGDGPPLDMMGDVCDPCPFDAQNDEDGDGLCANVDNCFTVANPLQEDADTDGVGNVCDNCPFDFNPGQTDSDNDGLGNVCDPTP